MVPTLKILKTGLGASVQDLGRKGWRRFGVPPAGAMDPEAMKLTNQLIGNRPQAASLELMLQGTCVEFLRSMWVAVGGADLAKAFPAWSARRVEIGEIVEFKGGLHGLWAYLAIPGGIIAESYFESVSVDARSGIGEPLKAGSILYGSAEPGLRGYPSVARRLLEPESRLTYSCKETFELLPGPQYTDFEVVDRKDLTSQVWQVSTRSDRTGYRLEGKALSPSQSIHSEPVLPGSFQVTSDGRVIVTQVYGPTVGGYPKIAILQQADLARFVQCRPGTQLNFVWKS